VAKLPGISYIQLQRLESSPKHRNISLSLLNQKDEVYHCDTSMCVLQLLLFVGGKVLLNRY